MMDRAYHREYSRQYYHQRKNVLIALLGGCCVQCGSKNKLTFDHKDPNTKKFSLGKLLNYAFDLVLLELSKCQLLCTDCHKEKTAVDGSKKKIQGSNNSQSKLSEADVIQIRLLPSTGVSIRSIAKQFNVSHVTIQSIIRRQTWSHVL